MSDFLPPLGAAAGLALMGLLAIRELRWPKALGRMGVTVGLVLFAIVAVAATLRIASLLALAT